MNRNIRFAYNKDDGTVISKFGDEIAVPVLDYLNMTPSNGFEPTWNLEAMPYMALHGQYDRYVWTRKIPTEVKNMHREFWGFFGL